MLIWHILRLPRSGAERILRRRVPRPYPLDNGQKAATMSVHLTFPPPGSIEDCLEAGYAFGRGQSDLAVSAFTLALDAQLVGLLGLFQRQSFNRDSALAAFTEAAWDAWDDYGTAQAA
jgi:hypothetical protein